MMLTPGIRAPDKAPDAYLRFPILEIHAAVELRDDCPGAGWRGISTLAAAPETDKAFVKGIRAVVGDGNSTDDNITFPVDVHPSGVRIEYGRQIAVEPQTLEKLSLDAERIFSPLLQTVRVLGESIQSCIPAG